MAGQREYAVDRQIGRRLGRTRRQRDERVVDRDAERVEARARHARDRDARRVLRDRAAQLVAHELFREREFVRIERVGLGEHDDRARDVEVAQDREVLERLRLRALVRGHHQQQQFHAGGARQHVVQEAFVTRDVDDASFHAVGKAQVGEPEVEGHAAQAFFDPTVRIRAGQRAHERRLAVIHVSRGAEDVHRD